LEQVKVGDLLDLMLLLVFGRIALQDDDGGGESPNGDSPSTKLLNAGTWIWLRLEEGLEDCDMPLNC
jgi:hypothetical protein